MEFLISALWMEGEAARRGLVVTRRQVRRRFTEQREASFPKRRRYQRFLRQTGQTTADILFRVRSDELFDVLRDDVLGRPGREDQRQVARFERRYTRRWTQRTRCLPEYAIDDCGGTLP